MLHLDWPGTRYSSSDRIPASSRELTEGVIAGCLPRFDRRLDDDETNCFLDRLLACWQILPTLTEEDFSSTLRHALPASAFMRLRRLWLVITAFSCAQTVASSELLRLLASRTLRYSLLKGSATSFRLYEKPEMRTGWDLDIGVTPADLRAAEEIVLEAGYVPAQQDPSTGVFYPSDPDLRASVEASHYELGFLVKRLRVTNLPPETLEAVRTEPWAKKYWFGLDSDVPWCYASVDVHHAISLDIGLDDLLQTARPWQVGGQSVRLPADEWIAAHTIYKLYWEGVHNYGKGLYSYADLTRLIPCLDPTAFESLVAILRSLNLVAAGFYVLRRLPAFGVGLPEHVQAFIDEAARPPAGARPTALNDLGDMWPKLWGDR